ncbi:MAG: hypothetical protein R2838_14280 [Caldilineaceae bacterium]
MMMMPWAMPEVPVVMIAHLDSQSPVRRHQHLCAHAARRHREPQWLQVPALAMGWMVLIASWKAFPFYSLSDPVALQAVPEELYEAAGRRPIRGNCSATSPCRASAPRWNCWSCWPVSSRSSNSRSST